jgi:phage recombination protein Bet
MSAVVAENMVGDRPSLVKKFANKYTIDPKVLMATLKQTAFKSDQEVTDEQMVALLVVADQYNLNPFTKEIYAYPDKHKGIVPVVSIDGWVRIVNEHPDYNGYDVILPAPSDMVIALKNSQGEFEHPPAWPWISILMHRKRVEHTPTLTEYFDECYKPPFKPRGKDYFIDSPWQTHPKRFLRHKAFIQAARVVFGFAGIYDEDEAQRILEASVVSTQGAQGTVVGSRTDQAKNALKAALEDNRGKNTMPALDPKARELDAVVSNLQNQQKGEPSKARDAEWTDKPAPRTFQYDVASALAYLRMQKSAVGLKAAFKQVYDDYEFSGRELPLDIEAIYRDLHETFEEREAAT